MSDLRSWLPALALGAAALPAPAGDRPVPDGRLVEWADRRVAEWQPKPSERRIDEIGWSPDIRTARRLSRRHGRPVFLFTMDGRIQIGRC